MCVTGWNERFFDEMAEVVRRGVSAFKHFMAYKGALMVNDDEMFASFSRCAALGALPLVHAENGDVVAALQTKLLAEGVTGPEGHAYSRPPEVEGEAANRAIMIADAAGCPLYIVHVSCEQTHEAIRQARQKGDAGLRRAAGAVPGARRERVPSQGLGARRAALMSPPFQGKEHQAGLWAGLAAGSLQVVATDVCLHHRAEEARVGGLHQDPERHRGLEDRMSVVWTYGVETGRLTPEEFVAVTSTNSAKILNMHPGRGDRGGGRRRHRGLGSAGRQDHHPRRTGRRSTTTSSRG